ncbi:MAG: DUF86 domain-containing protein [Candidatus ainarchaeum sp.]|nr:DUF86 domain-containing protein [Candidatus ainarchaeum sp.]
MKKDEVYAGDVLQAISEINKFVKGSDRTSFARNDLLSSAVVRKLEIIGEACKNMSQGFREKNSDILWRDIIGMRDKIVHNYAGIDFFVVWDVVQKDLPVLERQMRKAIEKR